MDFRKALLATVFGLLLAGNAAAATWERPAGAYTPTNHSANITKYQTDSANHTAISSAKVDGDLNKAFQGLNDIDARTAPSVLGKTGLFLTNDGSSSFWGLISPTAISGTGVTAGYVLQANGTGGVSISTLLPAAFPASGVTSGSYLLPTLAIDTAGRITSATEKTGVSLTSVSLSGTLTVSGTSSLGAVSASSVSATTMTNTGVAKAWVTFNGNPGFTSTSSIIKAQNIATVSRTAAGNYDVKFTSAMADANYSFVCMAQDNGNGTTAKTVSTDASISPTTAGFRMNLTSGAFQDSGRVMCVVFD